MEEEDKRFRELLVIAGASHALDFIEQNPKASKDDAIRSVTENSSKIIERIDEPL